MATQHVTLHFSRFNSSNVTIINDTNPVGQNTTNEQLYAQIICDDTPGSDSYGFWQLDGAGIPSDAYNISITNAQARCAVIGINDPNDIETYVQLYKDINTPSGDPSNNPFPIDPQGGNVPIDNPGTWTLSQIRTFYMKVCGNNHRGLAGVEIFVFGVDVDVEYETATPSPDYEIGTGAWYSKIGGAWKEIYKMYYKVGNAWKEVAYAYRKQDNTWYSIYKDRNPIIQADFVNSSLACSFPLDNTTSNFTIESGKGSATANGLSLNGRNVNDNTNFVAGIQIPTNTLNCLRTANQDLWFTAYITMSSWGTGWRAGSNNGFGNAYNSRNDQIHNFFELNNPTFYHRPTNTTINNNTPTWIKFQLSSQGYMIAKVWENNQWITCKTDTTTSKALWNNTFTHLGFHGNQGAGNMLIRYFKAWTREPTNAEIGI